MRHILPLLLVAAFGAGATAANEPGPVTPPPGGGAAGEEAGPPPGALRDAEHGDAGAPAGPGDEAGPKRRDQGKRLEELFTTADADASGGLSPAEFEAALTTLHEQRKNRNRGDKPKDEAAGAGAPAQPAAPSEEERKAAAAKAFAAGDADKDGALNREELKAAVRDAMPRRRPPPKSEK